MAKAFNQVTLMGRLVADPELSKTKDGKNIGKFTLAVDKTKGGTNFIDCTAWDHTAEFVTQYLKKGNLIHVSGVLDQSSWEYEGKKYSKLSVSVYNLVALSDGGSQQTKAKEDEEDPTEPIDISDIPF